MNRGLYISSLGMATQMKKMDVISNNIANVDTTGFKKDGVETKSFNEQLMYRVNNTEDLKYHKSEVPMGKMNMGLSISKVYTDFSNGSLKQTNGSFDVALDGDGFFAINVTDKSGKTTKMYTRDGSFTRSTGGKLLTKAGNEVLGTNGPINLPDGEVNINEFGNVYVNGNLVDQLQTTSFSDNTNLKKYGENLYTLNANATTKAFTGKVEQGFLEGSNVSSVKEMVDMISLARVYEANQKMIQTHDEIMGRAVTDIAKQV